MTNQALADNAISNPAIGLLKDALPPISLNATSNNNPEITLKK